MRKLIIVLCLVLVGCGFHLRGSQPMPAHLQTMAVLPDEPFAPLQREVRRSLKLSGITVISSPTEVYTLYLDRDYLSRRVLIIGTDGQTKQEEIIYNLIYRVKAPGQDPMPQQTISVQRILNVDYNRTLGQTLEEETLISEMRAEVTSQLMRRISVLKP